MKNIHVLSTNKPSILVYDTNDDLNLTSMKMVQEFSNKKVHIYITSDEEIKEGDVVKIPCGVGKVKELFWKFGNDNPSYIVEDIFTYKLRYGQKEDELQINSFRYEDVKKIILTTDQDLIKEGVQAIDDEFLEWFVKNPSCEEVKVDLVSVNEFGSEITVNGYGFDKFIYKIIIPKEEPKQETLEEAAEKYANKKGDIPTTKLEDAIFKQGFIDGAKWQQEQMYSEEDLRQAFRDGQENINYSETYGLDSKLTEHEWFEQFKKK